MHQIDRAVGLQQVAPCPPSGMRLTGHQQNAQTVAHAVDLDQRGVVAVCQLSLGLGDGELDHVAPAMRQGHGQLECAPDLDLVALRFAPIDRDFQRGGRHACGHGAHIIDPQGECHRLTQDGEGGSILDNQAAVPVIWQTGVQQMQRCRQIGRAVHVMNPAIAEGDDSGDAAARLLGQRLVQGGHQGGATVAVTIRHRDPADFGVGAGGQCGFHALSCVKGAGRAVAQRLTGGFVHQHQHDVGERGTVFLLPAGAGQGGQHNQSRHQAQRPTGQATHKRQNGRNQNDTAQNNKDCPGQKRVKDDLSGHWPNLSRRAGT